MPPCRNTLFETSTEMSVGLGGGVGFVQGRKHGEGKAAM